MMSSEVPYSSCISSLSTVGIIPVLVCPAEPGPSAPAQTSEAHPQDVPTLPQASKLLGRGPLQASGSRSPSPEAQWSCTKEAMPYQPPC